jgi:uncharacterized damage-inducible protein DinB
MSAMEALLESWRINDRINRFLLAAIPPDALGTPLAKGKSVRSNFTHMHNVRLMWLKACAPDLLETVEKFPKQISESAGDAPDAFAIDAALKASGEAIEEVVRRAGTPDGRVKGFKPHAAAFVGYMIAHDTFHRAMAEIALRQAGIPIDDKTVLGTWEWGSR